MTPSMTPTTFFIIYWEPLCHFFPQINVFLDLYFLKKHISPYLHFVIRIALNVNSYQLHHPMVLVCTTGDIHEILPNWNINLDKTQPVAKQEEIYVTNLPVWYFVFHQYIATDYSHCYRVLSVFLSILCLNLKSFKQFVYICILSLLVA